MINNQRLVAASPTQVKVTLEVGALSETIEVRGGSELIQTQSGTVSSTLMTEQLKTIPLPTRNALYAVNLLPGVDTTGTVRDASIAGLPEQTINITLDGVNVNNNQDRAGDGFYAMVRPQLDAIEQVTLTTATQGAESAGQGAVQIRFVTRSGTNAYRGTIYDYMRHPSLNTNSWINEKNNLDKNRIILHQAGGSLGGPIYIPNVFDGRGKAFFFFNYEEFYQPTEATRTRTLLNANAAQGAYTYMVGGQPRTVNVMDIAARTGNTATFDPVIQRLIADARGAALTTGTISVQPNELNRETYIYQSPGKGVEHLPTTRLDFNLNSRHRLSGTYYWHGARSAGDEPRDDGSPEMVVSRLGPGLLTPQPPTVDRPLVEVRGAPATSLETMGRRRWWFRGSGLGPSHLNHRPRSSVEVRGAPATSLETMGRRRWWFRGSGLGALAPQPPTEVRCATRRRAT